MISNRQDAATDCKDASDSLDFKAVSKNKMYICIPSFSGLLESIHDFRFVLIANLVSLSVICALSSFKSINLAVGQARDTNTFLKKSTKFVNDETVNEPIHRQHQQYQQQEQQQQHQHRLLVDVSDHDDHDHDGDDERVKGLTRSRSAPTPDSHDNHNLTTDSPNTKSKFKVFYKEFWRLAKTRQSNQAHEYGIASFNTLPSKVHWKVCMEIAELAKRENDIEQARVWYQRVNRLEPYAPQGWLERAKLEEECGELIQCQQVMGTGLMYCRHNESLLVKSIKHQERLGNVDASRAILASLQHVSVDKVWKPVLEGALLEARAGNVKTAARVFKYLMKHVSWYGPVYCEAGRLEEKIQNNKRAIQIVEKGLSEVPRYGPLWFFALRLYAKTSSNGDLSKVDETMERAVQHVSSELLWKIYFEAAGLHERSGFLKRARQLYAKCVAFCPKNLRWKAWLSGARMEIRSNSLLVARQLLQRAKAVVPKKMKVVVMVEISRLEEFAGNVLEARTILAAAKAEAKHEWKVFLEAVMLEMRAGKALAAKIEATEALKTHVGTGRLWAILIQLQHEDGKDVQYATFKRAIKEVPKSGEVWCEGARLCLDPTSSRFNLKAAKRFLQFAINFTPQYGDSFIEYMRLKMLVSGSDQDSSIDKLIQMCINAEPNYGPLWFACKKGICDSADQVLKSAKKTVIGDLQRHHSLYHNAILGSFYVGSSNKENEDQENSSRVANGINISSNSINVNKPLPLDYIEESFPRNAAEITTKTTPVSSANTTPISTPPRPLRPRIRSRGSPASSVLTSPCTPSTVHPNRRPRTLENEKNSMESKLRASRIVAWEENNINSLQNLYAPLLSLPHHERYRILFGTDPII